MSRGKHIAQANGCAVVAAPVRVGRASHAKRSKAASHTGVIAKFAMVSSVAIVVATAIGFGFASAGTYAGSTETSVQYGNAAATQTDFVQAQDQTGNGFILEASAYRDMSGAIAEVQAAEEAERLALIERINSGEQEAIERAQKAQAEAAAYGGNNVYAVDFSVGRDAFLAEWTARIDAYLAGSPLAGYGETFALAAWENGVDPRWSPAISNTESTKGSFCFAPHNAWGWTGGGWSDWVSAINAHVAGLAEVYGYTISYANAQKYCPPNYQNWYRDTLNEMAKI